MAYLLSNLVYSWSMQKLSLLKLLYGFVNNGFVANSIWRFLEQMTLAMQYSALMSFRVKGLGKKKSLLKIVGPSFLSRIECV